MNQALHEIFRDIISAHHSDMKAQYTRLAGTVGPMNPSTRILNPTAAFPGFLPYPTPKLSH
eukprot:746515-Hanusia_phi.AAC.2